MHKKVFAIVLVGLILVLSGIAMAGSSVTQTVTLQVSAINQITVSGNPGALTVSTATAGADPDMVTDATTKYNLTTNGTNMKITGQVDTAVPANTTLSVALAAPTGATSAGDVSLTASPASLVTGITQNKGNNLTITYKFTALLTAGAVNSTSRTVTLTVLQGP